MIQSWQHLPFHINPIAFNAGPIQVSWYGLMYLAGFAAIYFLVRYRIQKGESKIPLETIQEFFPWAIVGLLLGARLGDVLIYDWAYFKNHLSQIFLPFDIHNHWQYVGIYGMSFFGGLVGLAIAFYIFAKIKLPLLNKERAWGEVFKFTDLFAPAVPLALAFGRLGNFINGELFGRATTVSWGMYFPLDITHQFRHPSQIYEMFLEGILLFAILWSLRKHKWSTGWLTAFFLIGYGAARFASEFFRQPDNNWFFLHITLGQWMAMGIIILGIFLITKTPGSQK